ncbi:MAG TPA: PSD1 and planctomycete cytochrome C domain-containing protein [Abditibacteriaceae bacterium]
MLLVAVAALPVNAAEAPNARDLEHFESKVRPLLVDKCYSCHGTQKQRGGLRMDSREAMLKGGDSGTALVPGDPQKSLLVRAFHYEGELKMPPAGKLKAEEIAALSQWVQSGAPWPTAPAANATTPATKESTTEITPQQRAFWSFQPVQRPLVPKIKNKSWAKSPLDNFILAELEKRGLQPAPPADKRTLLRRATFDLTGLPPTPDELRAFLDDKAPDAYEKVIDRLLASQQYGERWGRHWLDVARYTDSLDARGIGGEGDISEAWRYRDWVVQAFNRDLPYDQFIKQQIAGDIIAASEEQFDASKVVATSLLTIGNWGNGDADKEKLQTDIADDQVDIVTRGFMGLTVSCARCHDHKYDPISTKDYYALAGIFFSTHILPKMAAKGSGENPIRVPLASPAELEKRKTHEAKLGEAEAQLNKARDEAYSTYAREMLPQTARYLMALYDFQKRPAEKADLSLEQFATQNNLHPHALRQWRNYIGWGEYRLMSTPLRDVTGNPGVHGFRGGEDTPSLVVNTNNETKKLGTFSVPALAVNMHPGPKEGVALVWRTPVDGTFHVKGGVTDADSDGGDGIAWAIDLRRNGLGQEIAKDEIPNGGAQKFESPALAALELKQGDAIELLILPKATHYFDSTTVDFTIESADGKTWNLARDIVENLHENGKGNPHSDKFGNPAVWSFGDMAGTARGQKTEGDSPLARWQKALGTSREEVQQAADEFQKSFAVIDKNSPFWISQAEHETVLPQATRDDLTVRLTTLNELRKITFPPLQYANAAQEGGVPGTPYEGFHDVRVHKRGSYAKLGEQVPRAFPAVLNYEKQNALATKGSGRLELAKWLASDKHPLTARVLVNRLWQHHFGEAIVRTPGNFGFLGERPTHPQLLDYLASEFTQGGWSLKKMHRALMLSATYQQASQALPKTQKADPDNRLFGRMMRRRLEAEAIRDNLLFVAGRLNLERGGPSIRDFKTPRRTLYITTIRSDRAGYGPLFDAADSTAIIDKRTVSTVAPQALFLMNDPFVLEQAQAFAKRFETVPDLAKRINVAYETLFGRAPTKEEMEIGHKFLKDSDGKAWEQYCQILLCSNEFVYVD